MFGLFEPMVLTPPAAELQKALVMEMDTVDQLEEQVRKMQMRINNQRRELRRLNAANKRFIDGAKAYDEATRRAKEAK